MSQIKVGIIGAGKITRNGHLWALNQLGGEVNVVAIADIMPTKAQKVAIEYHIPYVFQDYKDLLKLNEMEAVLISVPNYLHAQIAIDAMQAGKHVLCEKPMAINGIEAKKMLEVQKATKKILMIAQNNRFRSDIQYVKNAIEKGELGNIYHVKCGWNRRAGIPGWGGWFTDKDLSGGGPLLDLGVHMLDLAIYLLGNPRILSVVGSTYSKYGSLERAQFRSREISNPNGIYNVEDYAVAFIRLEDGITLNMDTCWAANIESDMIYLNLIGTAAGAQFKNDEGLMVFKDHKGEYQMMRPPVIFDYEQARVKMWQHFISCIHTGNEPLSSAEQGKTILKILDAIYESSKTGKEVVLHEI